MANDQLVAFWELFRSRAANLAAATSADDPVYDELLEHLQRIDPGLFLEFSTGGDTAELIVTAEGNQALFDLARSVVAAAPAVRGWSIRALKPQLGFPESTTWDGQAVRIADVGFEPLSHAGSDDLGLRVFVPGITADDVRGAHAAILRALDHGLGEERFARTVAFLEVRPLTDDVARTDLIPLKDLDVYIQWREARRGGRVG
jgi:hypothetical protein